MRALLIVDVQKDFVEGGSLAVKGGKTVAKKISDYVLRHHNEYQLIITSRDWHDQDGTNSGHFASEGHEPDWNNTWPVHCVANQRGSEYADEINIETIRELINDEILKGQGEAAYSAFEGISSKNKYGLAEILRESGIGSLDIVGIATDYCVAASATDAITNDMEVNILLNMCAAVDSENLDNVLKKLSSRGIKIIK